MKFPSCKNSETDDTFYSWCTGCEIKAGKQGCVLSETEEPGKYSFTGKTPNGGSQALLFFTGDNDVPSTKTDAKFVEIQELDEQGRIVHVDHGLCDPYRPPNQASEDDE